MKAPMRSVRLRSCTIYIWSDARKILMKNCWAKMKSDRNRTTSKLCYSRGIGCEHIDINWVFCLHVTFFCFKIFHNTWKENGLTSLKRLASPRHLCGILFHVFQGKELCAIIIMRRWSSLLNPYITFFTDVSITSRLRKKRSRYVDTS